jgi:acetyl esterase/lipase
MAAALKYAHLSGPIHPEVAPLVPLMKEQSAAQWAHVLGNEPNLAAFRESTSDATLMPLVPSTYPQPGIDYEVRNESLTVRDGASVGVQFYEPLKAKRSGKEPLVVKFHGGGFVVGSHAIEEVENRLVATEAGAVVASIDYRMAPEYKFPYAVNDCFDALKWCAANAERLGVDKNKIILAGGSAGGNLVSAVALMAKIEKFGDNGEGKIAGVAAMIPATCHPELHPKDKYELQSLEQNAEAPTLPKKSMMWFWKQYVPDANVDMGAPREYHSPLLADDLTGLPPFLIQVAGLDPLRDEGMAWAEALKDAGVKVELKVYPGLPHGFYFLSQLKESNDYWQAVVDFVKRQAGV